MLKAKEFVTINAGRNVKSQPMSKERWLEFQKTIRHTLHGEIVGQGRGSSQYNGQKEDFSTFHVLATADDHAINRHNLARIARYFEQEAISYTISEPRDLVHAAMPLDIYL